MTCETGEVREGYLFIMFKTRKGSGKGSRDIDKESNQRRVEKTYFLFVSVLDLFLKELVVVNSRFVTVRFHVTLLQL